MRIWGGVGRGGGGRGLVRLGVGGFELEGVLRGVGAGVIVVGLMVCGGFCLGGFLMLWLGLLFVLFDGRISWLWRWRWRERPFVLL